MGDKPKWKTNQMKSEFLNLPDDYVELLHNPNLSNRSYMFRIMAMQSGHYKYETVLKKNDLKKLADFIYDFLEDTNDEPDVELY